ncbi:hypothetical protein JKF63_02482 [Porcisia hertigi]|uniref:Pentacotripeptide-repeat region of PRORP domain-containing protein n=1 Tax=Porcisia hertigi TaxID=2761500 RepID=A0A836IF27_9TRYP|nr:hypothetical protein JKF63_02482 [Porcisia hertigi]
MYLTKRPPAELFIRRRDGTEDRFVQSTAPARDQQGRTATSDDHDETYQLVMQCAPYTASFNALLSKHSSYEDSRQLVAFVHHRMHSEGIPMNTQTYNHLMRRVVRYTDGVIFTLYEELKREGLKENTSVRPNMESYVLLFRACERSAQYNRAFLLYQQLREQFRLVPETTVYNTLLGYCAAVHDVAQATFLVEEMKTLEVPRDVNTYNCLMSVLVESAPYAETLKVFQELLSLNLKPTNRSYNTILKAASKNGDYDRTFQFVEEMKKKGLVPDVETYNYMLTVCEQRLDYVRGTGAFSTERRSSEQVMRGLGAIAELVMALLREMRSIQAWPDTYTYNKALSILISCKDRRVFYVYNDMILHANEVANHCSSSDHFSSMFSTGLGVGKDNSDEKQRTDPGTLLEEALQAEDEEGMGNMRSSAVKPNLETWRQMIKACIFFHEYERAKEVCEDYQNSGMAPNAPLVLQLLEVCGAAKDLSWAKDLIEGLRSRRILIGTSHMNALLRVFCAVDEEEAVFAEYEQMRMGIHPTGAWPDTDTCNIVLRYAYKKPDKAAFAEGVYISMVQPYSTAAANEETFCIRLEDFTSKPDTPVERVVAYANEMVSNYAALTIAFYRAVLRFFLVRDNASIQTWFDRLGKKQGDAFTSSAPAADVSCYAIMMQYYLNHGQYDRVEELFQEIQCDGTLDADTECYHVLLETARRQDDVVSVMKLMEMARVNYVALDVFCYNSILQTLVGREERFVYEVLSNMKENEVEPAESTIAIFLNTASGRKMLTEIISGNLFYRRPPLVALQKMMISSNR